MTFPNHPLVLRNQNTVESAQVMGREFMLRDQTTRVEKVCELRQLVCPLPGFPHLYLRFSLRDYSLSVQSRVLAVVFAYETRSHAARVGLKRVAVNFRSS